VKPTTTIAVDIAKNVFQVAVSKRPGRVAEEHRLSRTRFLRFFAQRQPATVLLEACGTAHHWARKLRQLGHSPVLLPVRHVAPYRTTNKTDRNDARALLEASRNEKIVPVPVKSIDQQSLTALHRLRSQWLADRTARINTLRGLLRELGHFIPQGARHVIPAVWELIEDADSDLPSTLRPPLAEACLEIQELGERIRAVEAQLRELAKSMPAVRRLRTVPGVGLLTSTAMVAFVGDPKRFPTSRHFAAFLGLTPRERSTGERRILGRISKRGDRYLRMLLVHGARAVLLAAKRAAKPDRLRQWGLAVERRTNHNKATCALANKLARIVWAVWSREQEYRPIAA
jgi:transposase